MKIAIVVKIFPALSETFILNQITGLIDLGHEVDIVAFRQPDENAVHPEVMTYKLLNKTVYIRIPRGKFNRIVKTIKVLPYYFFRYPGEIIKCFNYKKFGGVYFAINNFYKLMPFLRKQFDVIHCHFGDVANEFIFLKDIFPYTKFITTFHGYDIRRGLEKGEELYRNLFNKADNVISICSYNTEKLIQLGCPADKIILHCNGINLKKFIPENKLKEKKQFIITTVGRLVAEKNILFALDIVKSLKDDKKYKFKYYLIGNGDFKETIQKKIYELHLEDTVELLGGLPHDEVLSRLKDTDIFFLPSKNEAFPTVVLEAQAMAIPVVATDVGGVGETLKDGVSGYLIPVDAIDKARTRIGYLLENSSQMSNIGMAGRKFVEENFDVRKLTRKLAEIYKN